MANERRPDFTQRIRGAWEGFRNLRDDAGQNPGGVLLGAPPTGPMTFAEPTADERGRGAYDPYVSPPFRLAAAWSWRSIVIVARSQEHTAELQSRGHLVCRLPLHTKH